MFLVVLFSSVNTQQKKTDFLCLISVFPQYSANQSKAYIQGNEINF
jgi:hypothetical protein